MGELKIAGTKIPCAVIETDDGPIRIVVQREVVGLLTGNKKGGLQRYLNPKNLQPFLPEKFKNKTLDEASYVVEMFGKKRTALTVRILLIFAKCILKPERKINCFQLNFILRTKPKSLLQR
jgi:hypothetical protein